MKYLAEFRDPLLAASLVRRIQKTARQRWTIMEVCGGQTHTLVRSGIDQWVQDSIELVHGPGCPVCVTSAEWIDRAIAIAARPGILFTSFGDMLRVPGSQGSLLEARSAGADVRVVYSPLDAVELAARHPDRQVVFFAVGFETTAPATALAVRTARARGFENFSILVCHVLVTPAMEAILNEPSSRVQGFLAAGHVCAVTGFEHYRELSRRYRVPIVVAGFEPIDLLEGLAMLVEQLHAGRHVVENQYARVVRSTGNPPAQQAVAAVYQVCDREWRGLGVLPASGLSLRPEYTHFDAMVRFPVSTLPVASDSECQAGLVLQGRIKPDECPAFGRSCSPDRPLGAPMVSSEGACAAYWNAGRASRIPLGVLS